MTEEEYWFLDLVIKYWWPLRALLWNDLALEANKPSHNLSQSDVVDVLGRLFTNGDLTAYRLSSYDADPSPVWTPTHSEVRAGLEGSDEITFGLTEQGGMRWESVSKPDWNKFVYVSSDLKETEIVSADRERVKRWAALETRFITSLSWDEITHWQATYWKVLPMAHRLQYRWRPRSNVAQSRPSRALLRQQELRRERKERLAEPLWTDLTEWYTNPWLKKVEWPRIRRRWIGSFNQ